jgi:hypothetical protein
MAATRYVSGWARPTRAKDIPRYTPARRVGVRRYRARKTRKNRSRKIPKRLYAAFQVTIRDQIVESDSRAPPNTEAQGPAPDSRTNK